MKAYNYKRYGQYKTKIFPHGKICFVCRSFRTRKHWNQRQQTKAQLKAYVNDEE